ncbi:MAG: hypothetical protein J6X25_09705 [Bacteroidales bacterium]|nr:hypothetical protein [Bacteroidales bacterium]
MKKSFLFLSAAALVLAACSQEIIQNENNAEFVAGPTSFTAVMEGDESKAVIGLNGSSKPQTFWENGDAINVFSSAVSGSTAGFKFTTSLSANSTSAEFTYSGDDFPLGEQYFATYPYRSNTRGVNYTDLRLAGLQIPSSQTLVPGSFDKNAALSVAYVDGGSNTLFFQNGTALLKFRVSESNIVDGRIEVDKNDAISGTFRAVIDASTKELTVEKYTASGVSQNNFVNFSMGGTALSTGTDYYVAIAPVELTSDLKIYLNGNLVKVINKSSVAALQRNKIYNLGTLTTPSTPAEKVLRFDFSGDALPGWPTSDKWQTGPGELDCTYPLNGTDYHFFLTDCGNGSQARVAWVKASGGLILFATWRYVGLPAIAGYKLVKVSGTMCLSSKTRKAAIVKNVVADNTQGTITDLHEFVSGGESAEWSTKGTTYTFNLSGTEGNTMYYFLCTNTSVGVSDLTLTYVPI